MHYENRCYAGAAALIHSEKNHSHFYLAFPSVGNNCESNAGQQGATTAVGRTGVGDQDLFNLKQHVSPKSTYDPIPMGAKSVIIQGQNDI
jgi:hypothetical protein